MKRSFSGWVVGAINLFYFFASRRVTQRIVFNLQETISPYSRVHISSDEVFSMILKKPSILQKYMIPHMNGLLVFIEKAKKKSKWPTQKNPHFPALPILNIYS